MLPLVGDVVYSGAKGIKYLVDNFGLSGLRGRKNYLKSRVRHYENIQNPGKIPYLKGKARDLTKMEEARYKEVWDELQEIKDYETRLWYEEAGKHKKPSKRKRLPMAR
jgi:hypothetical protein